MNYKVRAWRWATFSVAKEYREKRGSFFSRQIFFPPNFFVEDARRINKVEMHIALS
jgi:hypothetical protein